MVAEKLTYEDYLATPDDGKRYEIIDGELYVSPSPGTLHQVAVGNLGALLWMYMRAYHLGRACLGPFSVILSNYDVVQPDVLWIRRERLAVIAEHGIEGAPDIVVEVISPWTSDLDLIIKRARYEFFGVPEHWIVDPVQERVRIVRPNTDLSLAGDDTITSPLLPEFTLPVHDIFHIHEA